MNGELIEAIEQIARALSRQADAFERIGSELESLALATSRLADAVEDHTANTSRR